MIGGFLGGAGESLPNWPADVLAEAVALVHAAGGRVAVHAVCPEAVDAVVAAGVDSVEHGWAVTDAHFAAMCARNMAWVPTLMLACCRRQVPCISRCMLAFKAACDTPEFFLGAERDELRSGLCGWHVTGWHGEGVAGFDDFLVAAVADGQPPAIM